MITENTKYGLKVIVPKTDHTSEFEYHLRQVRTINDDCKYEQELIAELEEREKPLTDEFLKLVAEMENWFSKLRTADDWREYNEKYGDFNSNYHDKIAKLEEEINNCSFEYANRSEHGWCL